MGLKINFMKKEFYIPPIVTVVEIETLQMLAISGNAPDSDDSEFGAPAQRRETWGDLWK